MRSHHYIKGATPMTSFKKLVNAGLVGLLRMFGQRWLQPLKEF